MASKKDATCSVFCSCLALLTRRMNWSGAAVLSFPNWACEVPEVCEAQLSLIFSTYLLPKPARSSEQRAGLPWTTGACTLRG